MKVLMKFGIVVVLLAMVTSGASAAYIWWDNDSTDNKWVTATNWNEGEFAGVAEVLEVLGDNPDTPEMETDFVLVPYQAAIAGYGNDVLPIAGQNVAILNIETTTTNVGQAGPIQVNIGTGDVAASGRLFIGRGSFSSDAVTVTVDGGSLTTSDNIKMGMAVGDVAVLNLLSGSISIDGGGDELEIGEHGTGTFNMEGGTLLAKDIRVSFADGTGFMTMSGGTVTLTDDLEVGHKSGGTGTLTMTGGSIIAVNSSFDIGQDGTGTVIMSGNSSITGISGDLEIADEGTGSLTMRGTSSITVNDDFLISDNGGTGSLTMTGDATLSINDDFAMGQNGPGTLNISGHAFLDIGDDLELGQKNGGIGIMIMSSGRVDMADDFELSKGNAGDAGTSTFTMTGGEININDDMKLAQKAGSATVVMLGGTINVGDSLRIPHEGQEDTTAHLTLGDNSNASIAFGAARINAAALNMNAAGNDGVDAWLEFQLGGLLVITKTDDEDNPEDNSAYVQNLIDDGHIFTLYAGDGSGTYLAPLGLDEYYGVVTDFDGIDTSVYLGVIPEPATMLLLGFGGLLLRRKRRVS